MALAALVDVELEDTALEMVGDTNTSTHYSLPGRARVTFPALPSSLGGRFRLLHKVTITIEGKAEYTDPEGRYTPLRVYRATHALLPSPYTIRPYCSSFGSITLDLSFDLRVPGWLPPSHLSRHSSTNYGLVADATVGWANETVFSGSGVSATPLLVDGQFALAQMSRSAYAPLEVRRHRIPGPIPRGGAPRRHYPFRCKTLPVDLSIRHAEYADLGDPKGIKIDMQLRASVSRWDEHEAGVSQQVARAQRDASESASERGCSEGAERESSEPASSPESTGPAVAHVVHIAMEVEEREDVRSTPAGMFLSAFPLPPQDGPLLGPSRAPTTPATLEPVRRRVARACLLLPNGQAQSHTFDDPRPVGPSTKRIKGALTFNEIGRFPVPNATGPFVKVTHFLKTHVTFERAGEYYTETFKTPVRLVTCPTPRGSVPPPYITVFHENGDLRDCDPLPLYAPAEDDVDMVEALTRDASPPTEAESSPSPPSSSRPLPEAEHRSAADDLSPANRKLFEQWAREASAPLEGNA
ncbi:hypothetical protein CcaverHIS631_0602990 [Cutaneotrichosporon cavernicola]|nr:hypothetical protein CcaverHIS631_0602990 [Cutaneotrichosporon cavernicola]